MKRLILSICFRIIDALTGDPKDLITADPQREKLIEELTEGVIVGECCHCPQGSTCEFFKLDEDGDELCQYGSI